MGFIDINKHFRIQIIMFQHLLLNKDYLKNLICRNPVLSLNDFYVRQSKKIINLFKIKILKFEIFPTKM